MTVLEVKRDSGHSSLQSRQVIPYAKALALALKLPKHNVEQVLAEKSIQRLEETIQAQTASADGKGPFDFHHNGDFSLARTVYAACRVLSPSVVLETGVAYGVTTAFALQALAVNNKGALLSIDLPPLGKSADSHVGRLIPRKLRERWTLCRGNVKRALCPSLALVGDVDVFVHDSLHTYQNMTFELRAVWPHLRPGALVIADDVGLNEAFHDFAREVRPSFHGVMKEERKDALFGILAKPTVNLSST